MDGTPRVQPEFATGSVMMPFGRIDSASVDCITLDLDDTLWDILPVLERAETEFHAFIDEHLPRITARHDAQSLALHRQQHYRRHPEYAYDVTYMRKHWLAEIATEFEYGTGLVEPAFQAFLTARNRVDLYEWAEPSLRALSSRFTLGAITNGNADLDCIGIGHYFDFVVTPAEAGAAKPSPEIFHAALSAAGTQAALAVHVGDDPERDVLGAAAVGMRTVWVNATLAPWPGGRLPDAVVRHVGELDEVLA